MNRFLETISFHICRAQPQTMAVLPEKTLKKENAIMSTSNKSNLNSAAKDALYNFKMEAAKEVGVNLKQGYNGDLTSRQAGSVGGQMVKKMIMHAENTLASNPNSVINTSVPTSTNNGGQQQQQY
jgi:small acid-soluble spore protein D (minor alpha/beta-type SASP)